MLAVRLSHFDQSRLGRLLDSPPRVFRFDAVILRRLRRASKAEGSLSENARFTPLKPTMPQGKSQKGSPREMAPRPTYGPADATLN